MEDYKQIPGYDNYGISPAGEVKNLKTGKILKPQRSGTSNYYTYGLCNNGVSKTTYVHKLMAITYMNHTPDGFKIVVDHINNNPSDNRLENLQLISNRDNIIKAYLNRSLPTGVIKFRKRYRAQIRIDKKHIHLGTFNTPEEASRAYLAAIPQ